MIIQEILTFYRDGKSFTAFSRDIEFSDTQLKNWERGIYYPTERSIKRLQKQLELSDEITKQIFEEREDYSNNGETKPEKITREDYKLMAQIEDKYETIANCPIYDPLLEQLHNNLGIVIDDLSKRIDKSKIDQMRIDRGLSCRELSEELGFDGQWFRQFMTGWKVNQKHLDIFANYFNVDIKEFERDNLDE